MVFESEPEPLFARTTIDALKRQPVSRLLKMTRAAAGRDVDMTKRQEIAYGLYSASFFEGSADARFLILMTAIEMLIELQPRSQDAINHIDALISATNNSALPRKEIDSIVGSLQRLRSESIGHAGRRLAQSLGDRRYGYDERPDKFFTTCYEMRSDLTHGSDPRPTWADVK